MVFDIVSGVLVEWENVVGTRDWLSIGSSCHGGCHLCGDHVRVVISLVKLWGNDSIC